MEVGYGARPVAARELRESLDVRGCRAAAAPDQIEPSRLQIAREMGREVACVERVFAVLVRESGVRHARDAGRRQLGQRTEMVRHQVRASGAVESDIEEIPVQQGDREGFGVLPGQHGAVDLDRDRDGEGHFPAELLKSAVDPLQSRLDVSRVLACLEEQVVGAAVQESE